MTIEQGRLRFADSGTGKTFVRRVQMEFVPKVAQRRQQMDPLLFQEALMGLEYPRAPGPWGAFAGPRSQPRTVAAHGKASTLQEPHVGSS